MNVYIYTLDDNNGIPIYVGITTDINKRIKNHINGLKNQSGNLYRSINNIGSSINMTIIDEVDYFECGFWESHYIFLYRSFGYTILNKDFEGGLGVLFRRIRKNNKPKAKKIKEKYIKPKEDKSWMDPMDLF